MGYILLPLSIPQQDPQDSISLVRTLHELLQERILNCEFPDRDQSTDKIPTGYERQNLDKRNAGVSETIIVSNLQAQDQPVDTLR